MTLFTAIKEVFWYFTPDEIIDNGLDQDAGYIYFKTSRGAGPNVIKLLEERGWISYSPTHFVHMGIFPAEVNNATSHAS